MVLQWSLTHSFTSGCEISVWLCDWWENWRQLWLHHGRWNGKISSNVSIKLNILIRWVNNTVSLFIDPSSPGPLVNMHILIVVSFSFPIMVLTICIVVSVDCYFFIVLSKSFVFRQWFSWEKIFSGWLLWKTFAKLTIIIIFIVTFQGLGKTLQCITLIWTLLVRIMN